MSLLSLLVLSASSLCAADPAPVKGAFKFPAAARTPSAPPPTTTGDVPKLAPDTIYVVPHDGDFALIASPPGLVTIARETGPLKVRGKFLDGSGATETRTFAAKSIAVVEPVPGASGRVELIAVPAGVTDEAKIERQMIDLGHGPQPPPKKDESKKDEIAPPKPVPPDVSPEPKPKPVVSGDLYLVLIEELDDRTLATSKFVNDVAYWRGAKAKGIHFRPYDRDEPEATRKGFLDAAAKANVPLPALLLLDADGDVIWVKPRPKDTAAVDALLKEVRP